MKIIAFIIVFLLFHDALGQATGGQRIINGTKLFVSVEGKGEPLLIIHGGPGLNHSYFKPHLQQLSKNFRVIYYDQRASGQSAVPSADSITMKFFIVDLEELRKSLNIKRWSILAHSWGAFVAVNYALEHQDKIKKLILSNPSMLSREFDGEVAKISKARMTKEDSVKRAQLMSSGPMDLKKYEDFFLLSFKQSAYDYKNLTSLNLNLQENFPQANQTLFTGLMKDPVLQKNFYDELGKIKIPVLVIHGQSDIIPEASITKLKSNLPDARLIVFQKSGHFPFIEEKDKFSLEVSNFLKRKK